jgi:hypothetical protein
MRYHHRLGAETVIRSESTSFLLARKAGGYLSLGLPNVTRYQGLCSILPYGSEWELVKSIESITIKDEPEAIILLADSVERVYKSALERFTVHTGAVTYEVRQYTGPIQITLDMRFVHDFSTWGRSYTVQDVPEGQVITYTGPNYSFCLAILGAKGTQTPSWRQVEYSYDKRRGSPAQYWVYDCLTYHCAHDLTLRFGVGWTPAEAISQARKTQPQSHALTHATTDAAVQAALTDLDGLLTTLPHVDTGILAGYPWFYQVWTRDEAISTGALIKLGNITEAKNILLRELHHMRSDGRIGNRFPHSEVASADGVGWTFLRLHELFRLHALSSEEQVYIQLQLQRSLQQLQQHYIQDELVHNAWKETWMDTTGGYEDGRAGARIEIQALTLRMYQFMAALCEQLKDNDSDYYLRKEELLRAAVRERFFDAPSATLADGIDGHVDRTTRPNIFIACYVYPQLLSAEEWQAVFRAALKKLWLPWGGLSTIDKEHLLFNPVHTGENDRSYHRGDSWYFVNNMAALCLAQYGFIHEAELIYNASRTQLLTHGIPGHAAEASGSKELEAIGCFSQAWSAATFLELWLGLHRPSS